MNATPIGGAALAASLADTYFTESVDILTDEATTEDTRGFLKPSWGEVTGLTGLACAVGSESPSVPQLQPGGTMVRSVTALRFVLASYHPEITTANRLRWGSSDYRIVSVFPDMTATLTHLSCELVAPGV